MDKNSILSLPSRGSALLDTDTDSGVALLRELGFIDNDSAHFVEEPGGEAAYCLGELHAGIEANETHLLLFLESSRPNAAKMSIADRMARLRDPSLIRFPIVFTVVDASTNSSFA